MFSLTLILITCSSIEIQKFDNYLIEKIHICYFF